MLRKNSLFAGDRYLALALLLAYLPVHAYTPLNTDDAGTTAKGGYQIDQYFYTLLLVGQDSTDSGSVSSGEDYQGVGNARAFPFAFSGGLTDNIDLQFTPTYYLQPLGSFSRVANYTVNLKWRFMGDGETGLNLALRPQLIAPSSIGQQEYGIGNAAWNYGLTFIASQFGENYELHFNAGYLRAPYNGAHTVGLSEDASRTNLYSVSFAPVWNISPSWKIALDGGINTNPNEPAPSMTRYGLVALMYSPTKDLSLGLSYQRNASTFEAAWGGSGAYVSRLQVGVTYRFD
ncbi:MAG: hypothetical protein RLZZ481_1157 [Pseudomonadota bacterium]|jgi:hypothetical protein